MVAGMTAARRFLAAEAASRPAHGAEQLTLAPPENPAHTLVKRKGVLVVRVLGDDNGSVWATGAATALASLPWPVAKWAEGADGRVVTGRACVDDGSSWGARAEEVEACYHLGWR